MLLKDALNVIVDCLIRIEDRNGTALYDDEYYAESENDYNNILTHYGNKKVSAIWILDDNQIAIKLGE